MPHRFSIGRGAAGARPPGEIPRSVLGSIGWHWVVMMGRTQAAPAAGEVTLFAIGGKCYGQAGSVWLDLLRVVLFWGLFILGMVAGDMAAVEAGQDAVSVRNQAALDAAESIGIRLPWRRRLRLLGVAVWLSARHGSASAESAPPVA